MRSRLPKLAVAAVLATSLPALAAARDCDHDHDHDRDHDRRASHAYAPPYAPWTAPAPYAPWSATQRWREATWRDREIAHLRAEFRELDQRRAAFYARHHRSRGQVRRFERWYAARRAELERRWNELHWVAWR